MSSATKGRRLEHEVREMFRAAGFVNIEAGRHLVGRCPGFRFCGGTKPGYRPLGSGANSVASAAGQGGSHVIVLKLHEHPDHQAH